MRPRPLELLPLRGRLLLLALLARPTGHWIERLCVVQQRAPLVAIDDRASETEEGAPVLLMLTTSMPQRVQAPEAPLRTSSSTGVPRNPLAKPWRRPLKNFSAAPPCLE